ncbi:MAG TPA: LysR family transcriptional regulator [Ktedonobacterales bacterium]|nr:LysR family transcriptional regulator [Ktedonobacterales bacterium]
MTLDQLQTFVQVARARSFSRAAVLLDLAQPTLSGRIAALELELGTSLFHRHGHTLELTEGGRALLPYAERMLALRAEGKSAVQRVATGGLGRLTLGANPTCSQYLAPRLIEAFWRQSPSTSIWAQTALSPALMESLLDGVVQLALCSTAQLDPRAQVLWSYSDPLRLLAARNHPLGRAGVCDRADLARHTILSTQAGPTRLGLRRLLPTEGVSGVASESSPAHMAPGHLGRPTPGHAAPAQVAIEATAGEVMRQLLLRGVGVTVLPALAVWDELQRGDLVSVTVRDAELPAYEIALVQWPGRELPPAAQAFVELTRAIPMRALLAS